MPRARGWATTRTCPQVRAALTRGVRVGSNTVRKGRGACGSARPLTQSLHGGGGAPARSAAPGARVPDHGQRTRGVCRRHVQRGAGPAAQDGCVCARLWGEGCAQVGAVAGPARCAVHKRTRAAPCASLAGVHPKQIGILVVNCSLFNPTPSLAAMVINHFKMRSNIISYNLRYARLTRRTARARSLRVGPGSRGWNAEAARDAVANTSCCPLPPCAAAAVAWGAAAAPSASTWRARCCSSTPTPTRWC